MVRGLAPRCASPRQSHVYGPSSVPDLASLPATPPPLESPSGRPHQNIVSAKGGGVRYSQRRIRPFANGEDSTFALRSKSGYGLGQASRRAPASRTAFYSAHRHGSFLARSFARRPLWLLRHAPRSGGIICRLPSVCFVAWPAFSLAEVVA